MDTCVIITERFFKRDVMKKILLGVCLALLITTSCYALPYPVSFESTYVSFDNEDTITMDNFWARNGKYEEKIIEIGSKLLNDNKIDKRVPFNLIRDYKEINAYSKSFDKTVCIYQGILPYIDSDDEFAYVIGHEISHSLDAYGGVPAWIANKFNSKHYEYKSDLMSIDFMVKAGYNPIAAITCSNKFMPEYQWDFGFMFSHPKTSKRLMAMYKYIRVKYPAALNSPMTANIHYVNFKRTMDRDIKEFEQKRLEKELKQKQKENVKEKI